MGRCVNPITTTRWAVTLAGACLLISTATVLAQGWPGKPVRFVVPFAPGGGNDILARVVGERLGAALGQPVVVDNRPGAGGNIGAELVARSAPDGYTQLVAAHATLVINPHMYARVPFDPVKDFAPVGLMGALPVVLAVHADVPAASVRELIALAKARPGGLAYASAGSGTPHHLAAEMFKSQTGTSMVHVPFKGGAPAAAELLSGRVQVMFAPINNIAPYLKSGKLRVLAAAGERRVQMLPDVPTIAEAGLPGYAVENWIGLAAPAGTSQEIIRRLNAEIGNALAQGEVRQKLNALGIEPVTATPAQMAATIVSELARWGSVIRNAGIKAD
ncbi:MAG: tripartite tricarboxylate transporter substrate binding protein [Burkholderiales bacterium]|nr:tripartite tricarboxylate transporter substrate binding protein [Burkholderiales bacterium]